MWWAGETAVRCHWTPRRVARARVRGERQLATTAAGGVGSGVDGVVVMVFVFSVRD